MGMLLKMTSLPWEMCIPRLKWILHVIQFNVICPVPNASSFATPLMSKLCLTNTSSADSRGETPSGRAWKRQRKWSFQSKWLWGGSCVLLQVRLFKCFSICWAFAFLKIYCDAVVSSDRRSIAIMPSVAAYNNRAQAGIKLKQWKRAMNDCQSVLELEPCNVKGTLFSYTWGIKNI